VSLILQKKAAVNMADTINVNASDIDAKILSILSDFSGKKLLSLNAGTLIESLLFMHPAPQQIIRTIVSQRCTEDLILLFCVMGPAMHIVQGQYPNININSFGKKIQLIHHQIMCEESPSFKYCVDSLPEYQKNLESIKHIFFDFLKEHPNEGFDAEKYISSHRDLLSYGTDYYMNIFVTTQESEKDKSLDNLVETIWLLREELALFREKYKKTP
jgi:hypothetical protein